MHEFLDYRSKDVMTSKVVSVAPGTTLARAQEIFEQNDFNALPVVVKGKLVGLLTKLDVLKAFRFTAGETLPPYSRMLDARVETLMTTDVETVSPRTPLPRVLDKMVRERRRSFVVEDAGRVVGMIGREDLLRGLRRAAAGERAPGPHWVQD